MSNETAVPVAHDEDYCKAHGLCVHCKGNVKTHTRIVSLFGRRNPRPKWEPLTILRSKMEDGNDTGTGYGVYNGYCMDCYTMTDVERLSGEKNNNGTTSRAQQRLVAAQTLFQRPHRRRHVKTNPDSGSVVSSAASSHQYYGTTSDDNNEDTTSIRSEVSGVSHSSMTSKRSILSGLSGMSGMSFRGFQQRRKSRNNKNRRRQHRKSSSSDMSVLSIDEEGTFVPPHDIVLARTIGRVGTASQNTVHPRVKEHIDQVLHDPKLTVLELQNINLMQDQGVNLEYIVDGLTHRTHPLDAVIIVGCQLTDAGMETLAIGFEHYFTKVTQNTAKNKKTGSTTKTKKFWETNQNNKDAAAAAATTKTEMAREELQGTNNNAGTTIAVGGIHTLCFRNNKISNRGIQALEFVFRALHPSLQELDLSANCIGTQGAITVLEGFGRSGTPLRRLNLSQNEIWELGVEGRRDDEHNNTNNTTGNFLCTNTSLEELNLAGNMLHDEGLEQLATALVFNYKNNKNVNVGGTSPSPLTHVSLGWNGIGDTGILALANAIEILGSYCSIEVLGLAENDCTDIGGQALLSALSVNSSMKEISGLYHNRIDRKFIIVAIKRLLHQSPSARGWIAAATTAIDADKESQKQTVEPTEDCSIDDYRNNSGRLEGVTMTRSVSVRTTTEEEKEEECEANVEITDGDEEGTNNSRRSSNKAASTIMTASTTSLEAIGNSDWGTFNIDEIGPDTKESTILPIQQQLQMEMVEIEEIYEDDEGSDFEDANDTGNMDRIVVFQSAPLAYFDRKSMQHHGLPLLDFESEARCLMKVLGDDDNDGGHIEVAFLNATQKNLSNFFAQSLSPVMHFSCFGTTDCITLENGFGYLQALTVESLRKIVSSSNVDNKVQVVVISSCNAQYIADAFILVGVPHVVSLQREPIFRDDGPINFMRGLYSLLKSGNTLLEAFNAGIERSTEASTFDFRGSYKLLPETSDHNVKVFFKKPPPKMDNIPLPVGTINTCLLPRFPNQFFGREVDMYEISESLRVDDVVRVGGVPGSGKKSLLTVLSRYILDRPSSFQIDNIYWLPPSPEFDEPDPDSLYGDLSQVMQLLIKAEDDIWEDEEYMEARERIIIEMEEQHDVLLIDGRLFTNDISGEMLEKFLSFVLNEANVKIIMITSTAASRAKARRSISEETAIQLLPLDFKSSVMLFANTCPFVFSLDGSNPAVDTINEFRDYLIPPSSLTKKITVVDPKQHDHISFRQKDLHEMIGTGIPRQIIERAAGMTKNEFSHLLHRAETPEISSVSNFNELERESASWTALRDNAIENKYYLRANDISNTLQELEALKDVYPSLDALKKKELDLKKKFSALLKAKRYEDANFVKRKLLTLKRTIMKERNTSTENSTSYHAAALESIEGIQDRMKTMMALAESMNKSTSSGVFCNDGGERPTGIDQLDMATFQITKNCKLQITHDRDELNESINTAKNIAKIVWTNEACELSTDETGIKVLAAGGHDLVQKISALDAIVSTEWGNVKCATGSTVVLEDIDAGGNDGDSTTIILAVPPIYEDVSTTKTGKVNWRNNKDPSVGMDSLLRVERGVQSALRSSFRNIYSSSTMPNINAITIPTVTSLYRKNTYWVTEHDEDDAGDSDCFLHHVRILEITLKTIVEEIKRDALTSATSNNSNTNPLLKNVRLIGSSPSSDKTSSGGSSYNNESKQLIKIGLEMGLVMTTSSSMEE